MRYIFSLLLVLSIFPSKAQDLPAYKIVNSKGKEVKYAKLIRSLEQADVVLFGELHNNALVHWLQLKVTESLHKKNELVLGAEMFEADDQILVNEYLQSLITESHLTSEAKVWKNYKTDYKPLLDYAKKNALPFVATNIPRRYASLVSREGLEALDKLSNEVLRWIAPLPIKVDLNQSGYKWMIETMGNHSPGDPANIARSQAIKDATMAHFILSNHEPGKQFIHYHGTFHSNNYQGIYHFLKEGRPDLKVLTIASIESNFEEKLKEEVLALADFIIVLPKDSPKTY